MTARLFLVVGAIVAAYALVWLVERIRLRRRIGLSPGITLVTAQGCRLCPAVESALAAASPRIVDASRLPEVRSVPTVLVVDAGGRITMRRSGRAALTDVPALLEAARAVA